MFCMTNRGRTHYSDDRSSTQFQINFDYASTISSEPDPHLTHIVTPSCFVFLHIPHNLAIMTIIPVIIILVCDRIFQNVVVFVFRHNDLGLHFVVVVFPSRQYSGANICIDPVMDLACYRPFLTIRTYEILVPCPASLLDHALRL